MPDRHLDLDRVDRAMRGEGRLEDIIRELLNHLIAVCPDCRGAWRHLTLPTQRQKAKARQGYESAFRKALSSVSQRRFVLESERQEAPRLLDELAAIPEGLQARTLELESRYWTWGVCDLLIQHSFQAAFEDPSSAEALAGLALDVAGRLDQVVYGGAFLADLKALAWAYRANARRIGSNLKGSERGLAAAEGFLARGTGDPLASAQVLSMKASLRRAQRRFGESKRLIERVVRIYEQAGDGHLQGRALVQKAYGLRVAGGDLVEVIQTLEEAVANIDSGRDPRLVLCARHNLIDSLIDAGKSKEAERLLADLRPMYAEFPDFWTRFRLRWVEGKLAQAQGDPGNAEAAFRQIRDGFLENGVGYDAALVSLDLAHLYAEAGRVDEVKKLGEEMLPLFEAQDLHREAVAALLVFQRAASKETVTLTMVRQLAVYLRQARRDPSFRFGWGVL